MSASRQVLVPLARLPRWLENFASRHGEISLGVQGGGLAATAADGAHAQLVLPWGVSYAGPADPAAFAAAAVPGRWGVLLVRRGGFAVATGTGVTPAATKVGRRHVQGQTKAGGWSQQRFARRRDNQARVAFEAAAHHAHRVLVTEGGGIDALVCGGDRAAVDAALEDPRLRAVAAVRVEDRWLATPDPSAQVLARAVADAWSLAATITDPA